MREVGNYAAAWVFMFVAKKRWSNQASASSLRLSKWERSSQLFVPTVSLRTKCAKEMSSPTCHTFLELS